MIDWSEIRNKFQALTLEDRQAFVDKLTDDEQLSLYDYPQMFLFDKQIITGDQNLTLVICGRGWGKTYMGSGWISMKIMEGAKKVAIIAPTYKKDLEEVMVPAILSWFPPGEAKYVGGIIRFTKYNGVIYCYSAETEVRGPNIEYCWCDEIAKWNDSIAEKVEETFKVAITACRIGKNPQILVTSTPKKFPLIFKWKREIKLNNPLYKMITGTMYDNPFLSDRYKRLMEEEYKDTPHLYRQEILGEILSEEEGAAWTQKMIDDCHISRTDFDNLLHHNIPIVDFKAALSGEKTEQNQKERFSIVRVVVAVDPSVSNKPDRDECGIIVAGLGSNGHVYVFSDRSDKMTTLKWAQESLLAVNDYGAGCIVIEDNMGKQLVVDNIRSLDRNVMIKPVTARNGKIDRALPVSALYARGLVHHIIPDIKSSPIKPPTNPFEKLEHQMTNFTGNPKEKSPDRLDALVWAVYDLKLTKTYQVRDFSALGSY